MEQEIWEELSKKVSLKDIIDNYNYPYSFQREYSQFINDLFKNYDTNLTSIEVGSSFGITSALLDNKFKTTLLDLDQNSLNLARNFFDHINRKVTTINFDMFKLNLLEDKYDLIFNSGVMEHFNETERTEIIKVMCDRLNTGGKIVLAIPNHYSFPYRLGYLYLTKRNKWIYPKENKIYDFAKELQNISGFKQVMRIHLDKSTVFNYVPLGLKNLFKVFDLFANYEGYLTVVVITKED